MRKGAIALLAMLAVPAACLPARAHAQAPVQAGEADCSTPRRALATWLANLQEGREHTDLAIRCFEWDRAGVPERDRSTVALRLKRVLDARGHFVVLDEIPDEEEPEDTTRVTPFPNNLPSFYLVRRDAAWLISAESIRATPSLYDETFALDVDALLASAPPWLRDRVLGLAWWQLLGLLLAIVTAFLLRQVVGWIVRSQGTKVLSRIAKSLDAELVRRAAMPIGTLGAVLLLDWMIPWLRLGGELSRVVVFGLRVGAAVSAVLIVYRMVDVLADVLGRRAEKTTSKLDDQLVPLVRKSLKVVTVILGLIFVLQNMEVDVASLIAGVSLGGLAFTLAARDTVANLFGSLSIFADQPFQVGDWVVMQGVEGIVEEVGMRSTRVRTFYRSLVSIPNSKVADGVIDNYGARDARRTYIKLAVQYDTTPAQMQAFCEGVRAILAASPAVKKDAYHVYFSGFGDSALEVMLYFFFVAETWADELEARHHVFLEILRLASMLGVQFAFPTRTLHLASAAAPEARMPARVPDEQALAETILAFGPGGERSQPDGKPLTHGFFAGPTAMLGSDPDADRSDTRA